MSFEQRLPNVSGDDGTWGNVLNQFLSLQHYNTGLDNPANGSHQTVTIQPGTNTAGTAPLKFASGSLLTTPEAGAVEFLTDKLYFTKSTGPTRLTVATYNDASGATGDMYYRDSSGNFVRLGIGSSGNVLTVASSTPSWSAPSTTGAILVESTLAALTAVTGTLGQHATVTSDPTTGNNGDYVWTSGSVWQSISSVYSSMPAGAIMPWAGSSAPNSFLICDGSAVSRTTYASLYAVIGTTYGVGDGSTTFNLPDLRGRVPGGYKSGDTNFGTLAGTGGEASHTLSIGEMPSHNHNPAVIVDATTLKWGLTSAIGSGASSLTSQATGSNSIATAYTGGGGAHNNLQPYITLNYIIKYSVGAAAGDSQLASRVGIVEQEYFNRVVNGNFRINQRAYVSGTALASGAYGFDRWKATTASTSLSFTAAAQGQAVTISANGSIAQIIEQQNMIAGTYTLAWSGTSLGRIYNVGGTAPSYAASPVMVSIDGTANVTVEFSTSSGVTGTLAQIVFDVGALPSIYRQRMISEELALCQRYYMQWAYAGSNNSRIGMGYQTSAVGGEAMVVVPVPLRVSPTVGFSNLQWTDGVNFNANVSSVSVYVGTWSATQTNLDLAFAFASNGAALRPGSVEFGAGSGYLSLSAEL